MKREFALRIIEKTRDDYNKISSHFDITRKYPWKEFADFKEYIKKENNILDLGCGNGRLIDFLKDFDIKYTGTDISDKLVEVAKENYPKNNFIIGDFLKLPFGKETFDTVFSIASFHHIPSTELRLESLEEIKRVLKKDGYLLITVWNLLDQEKYSEYIKKEEDEYDVGDSLIPWKNENGKVIADRYYHAFTIEESEELFKKAGFEIIESKKSKYNLLFVLKENSQR